MGLRPIVTNRQKMNEWYQNDFYEDMTEFYHPGYRKRIWTAPSVDLRNENLVSLSTTKLVQQDELGNSTSPSKSPTRKKNAQLLRQSSENYQYKQAMPQYIESPQRKAEREKEERKARRQGSLGPVQQHAYGVVDGDEDDSEDDALGAVAEAIGQLRPSDITEIKALKAPPQDVITIFSILGNFFRIGGNSNHDWTSVKKFL